MNVVMVCLIQDMAGSRCGCGDGVFGLRHGRQ